MIAAAVAAPDAIVGVTALDRRLDRVCGLVDAYLDVVLDDDSDRAAKAACEVALFARHLAMHGVRPAWARAVGARLVPRLRGGAVVQRLLWTPSRAGMLGAGHALLHALGHPDPRWDDVIDRLIRHPLGDTREVTPYEALEVDWVLGLLGRAPRAGSRVSTALARGFDPLGMLSDDAYALTHTVFYATDFGRYQLPAAQVDHVNGWCDAGAAWSVARADLDLAGEFVLAALCTGATLGASTRLALAMLMTTWDELGFVPDDAMAGLDAAPSRADVFFAIYHANLVAGLVAATLRAAGAVTADATDLDPSDGATLRAALEGVSAPRAAAIASALPQRWHARAAADLRIHHAARRRDLFAVAREVSAPSRDDSPSTAAARTWLEEFTRAIAALELPGARHASAARASLA